VPLDRRRSRSGRGRWAVARPFDGQARTASAADPSRSASRRKAERDRPSPHALDRCPTIPDIDRGRKRAIGRACRRRVGSASGGDHATTRAACVVPRASSLIVDLKLDVQLQQATVLTSRGCISICAWQMCHSIRSAGRPPRDGGGSHGASGGLIG